MQAYSCFNQNQVSELVVNFGFFRFVTSEVISFLILLLISHGGIEVNPGLKRKVSKFLCCHWNVNGILVHDIL